MLDGFVDDGPQLVGIGVRVSGLDVLNRAIEHMPAHGLLDEFRQIPFLHALGTQERAKGQVRFLRDDDAPANRGFHTHLCG